MQYVTSRGYPLPQDADGLTNGHWFNLWAKQQMPYHALEPGDELLWYETPEKRIVWRSQVVEVARFPYHTKEEVRERLQLSEQETSQAYFANAPSEGYCLSYKVRALGRAKIQKPDSFRFPQSGWLTIDKAALAAWPELSSASEASDSVTSSEKDPLIGATILPFSIPMVFLRTGWMDHYQGMTAGETISSGGAYVAEHGFGHEIFNFEPFGGFVFGYVQPPGRKDKWEEARINLSRLGASEEAASVPGVLAIWVATSPAGGAFIVGWYRNATIYRTWQPPPLGSGRTHQGTECGYFVTANEGEAVCLPNDERVFPIPQQVKGGFGRSNIWYADPPSDHREFRERVLSYIQSRHVPTPSQLEAGIPHQADPLLRARVERIAIDLTILRFTELGYTVDSFEKDNLGWDLRAVLGRRQLKLEVKGLSGPDIIVYLTPNEYVAMMEHKPTYRVCVVTQALNDPQLHVFAFSPDSGQWETADRKRLQIQEIVAAKCSAL